MKLEETLTEIIAAIPDEGVASKIRGGVIMIRDGYIHSDQSERAESTANGLFTALMFSYTTEVAKQGKKDLEPWEIDVLNTHIEYMQTR